MKTLAIIPARGGSKRLPGKNLALLGDRPLIAWSIAAALESGVCDRVLVSTEDRQIAAVACEYGAEVPLLRPAELAGDHVPNQTAIDYTLNWLKENQAYLPEAVFNLQPTSPFRAAADVEAAFRMMKQEPLRLVVSVSEAETQPHFLRRLDECCFISDWFPSCTASVDSKNRDTAFQLNGAIYLERLLEFTPNMLTKALIMPRERSIDIDTELDLKIARALLAPPQ